MTAAEHAGRDENETPDLEEVRERFILHWGEMGTRWGISRSVAQVHALLYISPEPLSANEIMDALQLSRGGVSMALRELIAWDLVNRVHQLGERREYYTSEKDVWALFRAVLRGRKEREVDPTIDALRERTAELEALPADEGAYERKQLGQLLDFFETGAELFEQLERRDARSVLGLLRQVVKLKAKGG